MKFTSTHVVAAFALAMLASPVAFAAGQFRVVPDETGTICQSGTKSDAMTIEGPKEVKVADGAAAICVSPDSVSAVHVRWGGVSSGTVGHGCAELTDASNIMVRAVNTNFHESATFYTCTQAAAQQ